MQVVGNYTLNVEVGDNPVPLNPQMIEELTISQDIDRFLPTFSMTLIDATKTLSDIVPYDSTSNNVKIEIARQTIDSTNLNLFQFSVKRRSAVSPDDKYRIQGTLNIPQLLTNRKNRAFSGSIKNNLIDIVDQDLTIKDTEIGASIDYEKNLLQPNWTDAKFFQYLRSNLIGKGSETGYFCFVKVVRGIPVFVFKSYHELMQNPISYNFIVGYKPYLDYLPISQYEIFDDSKLLADMGAQTQQFYYFDYETGEPVYSEVSVDDCPSLSEFVLLESSGGTTGVLFDQTGRSNQFTTDFEGRVKNNYFQRVNNFVHMWASTWGLENISPGDIVRVVFSEGLVRGQLFLYQHSGLWLVKRVVHLIGDSFQTRLLLTRCGIDTDILTSLIEAENRIVK